jgi:hypothetical protein
MTRIAYSAAAVWVALTLLVASAAAQRPTDALRDAVLSVMRAQDEAARKPDTPVRLDAEIATFTALIESGKMNPAGLSLVSFYRGQATTLMNAARVAARRPADNVLARASLADFDRVIASGIEIPDAGVSVAEAAYSAGVVARNYLDLVPKAYEYWDTCAQRGHAGCLNITASARLTGAGDVKVDLQQSVELHTRVYDTGTEYTCAGAFSALAISQIRYFGATRPVAVDELEWLNRGGQLLDELAAKLKNDNPCSRVRFEVAEYLMRLDRGDDRRALLERALKRADTNEQKATVGYLLGNVSEADFRKAAGTRNKDAACDMYFAAAWRAEIRKDGALAGEHRRSMASLGRDHCEIELALLKLKYKR